jgi:hypothetical protein
MPVWNTKLFQRHIKLYQRFPKSVIPWPPKIKHKFTRPPFMSVTENCSSPHCCCKAVRWQQESKYLFSLLTITVSYRTFLYCHNKFRQLECHFPKATVLDLTDLPTKQNCTWIQLYLNNNWEPSKSRPWSPGVSRPIIEHVLCWCLLKRVTGFFWSMMYRMILHYCRGFCGL